MVRACRIFKKMKGGVCRRPPNSIMSKIPVCGSDLVPFPVEFLTESDPEQGSQNRVGGSPGNRGVGGCPADPPYAEK